MQAPAVTVRGIIHPVERGQEEHAKKDLQPAVNEVCSARRRSPRYVAHRGDKATGAY